LYLPGKLRYFVDTFRNRFHVMDDKHFYSSRITDLVSENIDLRMIPGYLDSCEPEFVFLGKDRYSLNQSKYILASGRMKKNTLVFLDSDSPPLFYINNLGLKGRVVDSNDSILVVWGDSIVFGIGRGWVYGKTSQGARIMNGGHEGTRPKVILRNAIELNTNRVTTLNIFSLGWHGAKNKHEVMEVLKSATELPNLALMTLPTSLQFRHVFFDYVKLFRSGNVNEGFVFWGNLRPTRLILFKLLYNMSRQNRLIRNFAKKKRLPLFDLEHELKDKYLSEPGEFFFDLGHFRPSFYPTLNKILLAFIDEYESSKKKVV
jgi:hypothetical protein